MIYTTHYDSPIGDLLLASKNDKLVGLWIEGQKYYLSTIDEEMIEYEDKTIIKTKKWLDDYFKGKKPSINKLDFQPEGSDFRQIVWRELCKVPYGKTITYGQLAKKVAKITYKEKMSAQAIGGAVGHNPISIIIPCHRVVGSDGNLTGYDGGLENKIKLLKLEEVEMSKFFLPQKKGDFNGRK